jgi:hypothetical protein
MMAKLLLAVPQIVPADTSTAIMDDWQLYKVADMPDDWCTDGTTHVDDYWNKVFQMKAIDGSVKFKHLPKVIKPLLSLAHGKADPERGFSVNKRFMTSDRSLLSEASINGLRSTEDAIRRGGGVTNICVTNAMLTAVRTAAANNRERLEAEKQKVQQQEAEEKRSEENRQRTASEVQQLNASIDDAEKLLLQDNRTMHDVIMTTELMMHDANSSLQQAIKAKDMHKVEMAQALLAAAQKN